jgi:hypothetical protein
MMNNNAPVKLNDLISEIETQIDDTFTYINTQTGELITLTEEEVRAAENDKPLENFPDWQRENIEKAIDIIQDEEGVYLDFTLRSEYHEYEIIEEFIRSLSGGKIREALYIAIQGRGAFRRFKDEISELGIEKQWYEYKDKKIKDLVIEWCKEQHLPIKE